MAEAAELPATAEPNAVALATVSASGQPSNRMVLLKGYDAAGFTFFTNYDSRKGQELQATQKAALCFYWEPLQRQVRVEGSVEKLSEEESAEYYHSRPRNIQIGAWCSAQSSVISGRQVCHHAPLHVCCVVVAVDKAPAFACNTKLWHVWWQLNALTGTLSGLCVCERARDAASHKMQCPLVVVLPPCALVPSGRGARARTQACLMHLPDLRLLTRNVLHIVQELEDKLHELQQKYADEAQQIPKPEFWGGFRVTPLRIEFWHARPSRLHDRLCFTRASATDEWQMQRLSP